jgi:hypothetical protein
MSNQINRDEGAEKDSQTSGLLLSIDPLPEGEPRNLSMASVDDDNPPADQDADDTVGDDDTSDDTDTDTSDDADGTD